MPYDTAVSVMSGQLGEAVRMPGGYWINRCHRPLVDSDMHEWLYVGGLVSIEVAVERPGSLGSTGGPTPDGARITITYQVPTSGTDEGCTSS